MTSFQKLLLWGGGIGFLGIVLVTVSHIIVPFILAGILAHLFSPLVDRLESMVKFRWLSITILFGIIGTGIGVIAVWLVPKLIIESAAFSASLPENIARGKAILESVYGWISGKYPDIITREIATHVQHQIQTIVVETSKGLPSALFGALGWVSYLILVPFILFFLLADGHMMKKRLLELVPNSRFDWVINLQYKIGSQLGHYLWGILIEAVVVAVLSTIFLTVLGINYAFLIGIIAGFCNLIPYIGPSCGTLMASAIYYLQTHSVHLIIYIVIGFLVIQFIDNTFVQPFVYARSTNLHPLVILFSLLFGASHGLWGLILAVPTAGVGSVLIRELWIHHRYRVRSRLIMSNLE